MLDHPDLELVGHYVWSESKVGRDSGEIAGEAPDALLALNADCISFFGDSIGGEKETAKTLCRFLEKGTNVITPSIFAWAHPATCPAGISHRCGRGVPQGQHHGLLHRHRSGLGYDRPGDRGARGRRSRGLRARVMELGSMAEYTADCVFREYFGFGKEPGFQPLLVTGGFIKEMWSPTIHAIAEVLGVQIEELKIIYETDGLDHDIHVGIEEIKAGQAAAVHFQLQRLSGGEPIVIVEHNDLVDKEAGKQWPRPYGPECLSYRVEIQGDPTFTIEQNFGYYPAAKVCAMNVINAVCEASPGLKGPLQIPRYWTRHVRTNAKRAARQESTIRPT